MRKTKHNYTTITNNIFEYLGIRIRKEQNKFHILIDGHVYAYSTLYTAMRAIRKAKKSSNTLGDTQKANVCTDSKELENIRHMLFTISKDTKTIKSIDDNMKQFISAASRVLLLWFIFCIFVCTILIVAISYIIK